MSTDGLFMDKMGRDFALLGEWDDSKNDFKNAGVKGNDQAEAFYQKQKADFGVVNAETIAAQKKSEEEEIAARRKSGRASDTLLPSASSSAPSPVSARAALTSI